MKKPNYVFDDELYHWGILGQKWGTRRFQNEDGSLTAEGRERYGVGDKERIKIEKAKATYNTQKYKADLKSKAQMEKDVRSAKEERNRIKENSKTMLLARKKQSAFDTLNKKEQAKLENQGRPKIGINGTKNMSDEDLQKAIDRLKLQSEYNKQYVLATSPNSALAKADRFFDSSTGKVATQLAMATIPQITNTTISKLLDSNLKYANEEDREAARAAIEKTKAETEKQRSESENTKSKMANEANESLAKVSETLNNIRIKNEENERNYGSHVQTVRNKEKEASTEQFRNRQKAATEYAARQAIFNDQKSGKITTEEALERLKKYGLL